MIEKNAKKWFADTTTDIKVCLTDGIMGWYLNVKHKKDALIGAFYVVVY